MFSIYLFCGSPTGVWLFFVLALFIALPVAIITHILHLVLKESSFYKRKLQEISLVLKIMYFLILSVLSSIVVISTLYGLY